LLALAAAMLLVPPALSEVGATGGLVPPEASWWFRLRSTGYGYQSAGRIGDAADRLGAFQHVSGAVSGLASGRLTFRASARLADDLELDEQVFDRSRVYVGLLEARLHPAITARLGRQLVQEGVVGLTLDGALASLRPSSLWDVAIWGGARAPFDRDFEIGDFDDDGALGGRVAVRPSRRFRFALSGAYRERDGVVAERPVGAEIATSAIRNVRAVARAAYDLEREGWGRIEAQAQWTPSPALPVVSVQIIDRYPSLDAASYFARFAELERIRVARTAARYEHGSGFGGEIEVLGSFAEERQASRIGLAALVPVGRLGYSIRLGDTGEASSFYGDLSYAVLPWLRVGGQATFLTYALFEDAPEPDQRDLTTLAATFRARLRAGVDVTAELQSLENPFFSQDVRFLFGLDLTMARGASRFGLDRGGWLR
jgi:hypothetical protein